jgi:hypothetical protein
VDTNENFLVDWKGELVPLDKEDFLFFAKRSHARYFTVAYDKENFVEYSVLTGSRSRAKVDPLAGVTVSEGPPIPPTNQPGAYWIPPEDQVELPVCPEAAGELEPKEVSLEKLPKAEQEDIPDGSAPLIGPRVGLTRDRDREFKPGQAAPPPVFLCFDGKGGLTPKVFTGKYYNWRFRKEVERTDWRSVDHIRNPLTGQLLFLTDQDKEELGHPPDPGQEESRVV